MTRAIVLLSGGQDSTTCLYQAIAELGADNVYALTISYGQRHSIEVDAAEKIAGIAGVSWEHLELDSVLVGSSPLVSDNELGQYDTIDDLPGGIEPTFVPGRNALFLVLAGNRAMSKGATIIYTGVCEEDYGGYPDCRSDFISAMSTTLSLAMTGEPGRFEIRTPLMSLTKKASVDMAWELSGCWDALAWSHTCYNGSVPPCGTCHACHLRARGFEDSGRPDPLVVRLGGA